MCLPSVQFIYRSACAKAIRETKQGSLQRDRFYQEWKRKAVVLGAGGAFIIYTSYWAITPHRRKSWCLWVLAWSNRITATQSCNEQSIEDQTSRMLLVWLSSLELEGIWDSRGSATTKVQEERQPHSAWNSVSSFSGGKKNLYLEDGTWTVRRKTQVDILRYQHGSVLTALWETIWK